MQLNDKAPKSKMKMPYAWFVDTTVLIDEAPLTYHRHINVICHGIQEDRKLWSVTHPEIYMRTSELGLRKIDALKFNFEPEICMQHLLVLF